MTVYDRWMKDERQQDGSVKRVRSADYGCTKRWQVRYRDPDGNQKARSFETRDGKDPERHATAFDAKVKTALNSSTYIDPKQANTTLRDFAEDWRQSRVHQLNTAERLERQLRLHTYPAIGNRTLRELAARPSIVQQWIAGMKLADSTKRQTITDVSSIFNAAVDDGIMTRNPLHASSVTRPKPAPKRVRPWTFAEVHALAEALPGRYAILPYLGAGAGMRQGEMFGLAKGDITFLGRKPKIHVARQVKIVGKTVCFGTVKNFKEHDVPLPESLAPLLAEHMRRFPPVAVTLPWERPDGQPVTFELVLTQPDRRPLHRIHFNQQVWWRAQEKAGITPAREPGEKRRPAREDGVHRLRHTAASAWLSASVDVVSVAAWLGDTVKVVCDTYAHMMPDTDERGRAAMDSFFQAAAEGPENRPSASILQGRAAGNV